MNDPIEVLCRPKWYGAGFPMPNADLTKYKAIQISKHSKEAQEVFNEKYLNDLPENFIWKIITISGLVFRSNEEFIEEFHILDGWGNIIK